jgi:phage/plasmid-like protein (TIGR03299 family)
MNKMTQIETITLANEVPWEGVGFPISNYLTPKQMLVKAGLDWEVKKIPLWGNVNGLPVQAEHYLLVRNTDGAILDEVTESWQPCQNQDAFDIFTSFVKNGDLKMEVAGSLKNGKIVWALAKVNQKSFTLFGGDIIDSYLLFSNPHLFGQIISVKFSPIRRISSTTLTIRLENYDMDTTRLTHRRKFDGETVRQLLKLSEKSLDDYKEWALVVGKKKIKNIRIVESYFKKVFPSAREKRHDIFHDDISIPAAKCMEIYKTQRGSQFAPNTYWQAWNAINFYLDHCSGRSIDNRLMSSWFGDARKTKMRATLIARELSE